MILLLANLSAALFLTGLSWFLQIVQLPLLARLDTADFSKSLAFQRRRNTMLMAPAMAMEMGTAFWLAFPEATRFNHRNLFHAWVLLAVIWLITLFRHIPLNARLIRGYDAGAMRSLANWNWARTLLWTARCGFLLLTIAVC